MPPYFLLLYSLTGYLDSSLEKSKDEIESETIYKVDQQKHQASEVRIICNFYILCCLLLEWQTPRNYLFVSPASGIADT